MKNFRLVDDGDSFEKKYWNLFIRDKFQGYEDFWIKNVTPLTNRPANFHFKTDFEIAQIGKTSNDICIAQLHYSILRHLVRIFDILRKSNVDLDDLTDGMTRLCGALDVSFELLQRNNEPAKYDPWCAIGDRKTNKYCSREAREDWENKLKNEKIFPENIKLIRYYRNNLVHGRILPGIIGDVYFLPKIGIENKYFDWRKITSSSEMEKNKNDFIPAGEILKLAWNDVTNYLDNQWRIHLLKQAAPDKSIKKSDHIPEMTASGVWSTGVKSYDTSAVQSSASVYEIEKDKNLKTEEESKIKK